MLSLRALACVATALFVAINEAKKTHLVQEFNSRSDAAQSPQDPIIGNWSNLTARDNFTASITFQNGGFVGTWLAPSPRGFSTFACSPYTPGPWAYICYFFDLGVMLANISSSSSGWQLTWSDNSAWAPKATSANVSQVQVNVTLTGVTLASLSPAQQTSLRSGVAAAIAAEAGVSPNAVTATLTQVSFLLLSQLESSQTGSIRVTATISGVPTSSSSSLSRSLSSSSTLPSSVSTSIKNSTGLTVTTSAVTSTVVQTPQAAAPMPAGVFAWYDASNNPSTSGWNDLSGNGYHLTPIGSAARTTSINARAALDFSNGRQYTRSSVPLSSFDITVIMVVTTAGSFTDWANYMHHGNRDSDWAMEHNAWGNPRNSFLHFQSLNDNAQVQVQVSPNTQYIFVGRYAQKVRSITVYSISGAQVATSQLTDASYSLTTGSKTIYVGTSDNGERSNAVFGEILYYQRALSNSEVAGLVQSLSRKWSR